MNVPGDNDGDKNHSRSDDIPAGFQLPFEGIVAYQANINEATFSTLGEVLS